MNTKRVSQSNLLAKECIVSALLQLIQTKSLSSINVSELCNKAGVSRMTFYRNYKSIEDIFVKQLSEIFDKYKSDEADFGNTGIFCDEHHILHYFSYVFEYRLFLDGLVKCGYDVIFLNMLNSYIYTRWASDFDKYVLTAFAGSLYNMFRLWSDSNYTEDIILLADKLAAIFQIESI